MRKIRACAALALGFGSSSADAMKYGSPFRLNVYTEVQGVIFGSLEEVLVFPAGNGMREHDVLAQLRNMAKIRCQSVINTGFQNSIFTIENCF